MEPFIVCENLVKIYSLAGVEVMALQGLDLTIQPGEMVGIVGASGSGKSTLLNVLGGLDRPSAGRVVVGGQDLFKMTDQELDVYRKLQVGFVWQQTARNLVPYLTALENVELPMRLARMSGRERRKQALELLESLGLAERAGHLPVKLSGGEQQRTAIAVALANHPAILLADEPTGEVDSATAKEVYAALRLMNTRFGMTTVMVSHDPNLSSYTDRVVAIRDGKTSTETVRSPGVRSNGTPEEPGLEDCQAPGSDDSGSEHVKDTVIEEDSSQAVVEFEELVVLDSAGRLQIPREYLETLDIGDRVRVELLDGRIIIHPVAGRKRAAPKPQQAQPNLEELYMEEDLAPETDAKSLMARLRKLKRPAKEAGN